MQFLEVGRHRGLDYSCHLTCERSNTFLIYSMAKVFNGLCEKLTLLLLEAESVFLQPSEHFFQNLQVLLFIFPTHEDVIDVAGYPWNSLQDSVHQFLKQGRH